MPGFYRYSNEWHSRVTRRTYHWIGKGRWAEVSDSRDFWDFCEWHQRREPQPDGPYDIPAFKSCRSCFHVWLTSDEFQWDVEYRNSLLGVPDLEDEPICPLCNEYF